MNSLQECIHTLKASVRTVVGVMLVGLIGVLSAAGCEKKAASPPPQPQTNNAKPEAKPAPKTTQPDAATSPSDPQPKQAAEKPTHAADKIVLPQPQQIFDRYVEVTGGREAYGRIHNALMRGKITVTGTGQEISLTEYRAAPNKYLYIIESEDSGVLREGSDGEAVWQMPEAKAPRIYDGAPKVALLREGVFNSLLHMADLYEIVETVAVEEIDGIKCYQVLMTPPQGLSESNFYSIDSGLLVMRHVYVRGLYGDVLREVQFADYEETAGVRSPRTLPTTQMGQEFVKTIDSVEYNVELAEDFFDLPDEVRQALEGTNATSNEDLPSPGAAEQP